MSAPSFDVAMGHRLRREREDRGLTAADVALLAADRLSLGWDRSTVTRIELGQRQLLAGELVLLAVLYDAPVADLLPDERCELSPAVIAVPAAAAKTVEWQQRVALADTVTATDALSVLTTTATATAALSVTKYRADDATVKAAHRLGVDPSAVAAAAIQLWGRGLTAERDRRVEAMPGESPQSRGRRRGHVTRELVEDLRRSLGA
jgi:transcriptional regulator with XRE-family HTH domain